MSDTDTHPESHPEPNFTATRDAARHCYNAAVRLLASRDHSVAELTRKLSQREHDVQAIELALEELIDRNIVNDGRYADAYVEQRMNQGYGPLSIRAKLTERGVDSQLVQRALKSLQVDWSVQAQVVIDKRFSRAELCDTDQRATARIARFLHSRGFSSSDSLRALTQARTQARN